MSTDFTHLLCRAYMLERESFRELEMMHPAFGLKIRV